LAKAGAVVIGLGNWLRRDEGVGIHLVNALMARRDVCDRATLIDAGVTLDAMLGAAGADKLIVLDAISAGGEPGTVYRLPGEDAGSLPGVGFSLHEWSARDGLQALEIMGKMPRETVVIGVEPETLDWGTGLSPKVESSLPRVIELVLKELEHKASRRGE